MGGERIRNALSTLITCLEKISPKCVFNIVSFGSRFESMFELPQVADVESIQAACKKVNSFSADMGGSFVRKSVQLLRHRYIDTFKVDIWTSSSPSSNLELHAVLIVT